MRVIRLVLLLAVVTATMTIGPRPASACSCAGIGDLDAAIAGSQAAFVGTLIETRDPHGNDDLIDTGRGVVHVFEVERWIKADLGDVIEVHSAADGGACGLEFWTADNRIGAFLTASGGQLASHLCAQVDPDVLIAAADGPPVAHPDLAPAMAISYTDSARLTLLAGSGELVGTLDPTPRLLGAERTRLLSLCPGGTHLAQLTPGQLVIWDLRSYEITAIHDSSGLAEAYAADLICRDPDATSVWALVDTGSFGGTGSIEELVGDSQTVTETPKASGVLGPNHAIIWNDSDRTLYLFDYQTDETILLASEDPGGIVSNRAEPSPFDATTALLTVEYHEGLWATTTLAVVDEMGTVLAEHDLPDEGGGGPVWLDETRIAVQTFDYGTGETAVLRIIDIRSGLTQEIPGFAGWSPAFGNEMVFGINNGHVHVADLDTGTALEIAVLDSESAWEFVAISEAPPPGRGLVGVGPSSTLTTTPPLQQTDISPMGAETEETPTTDAGSPVVAASDDVATDNSSALWWFLGAGAAIGTVGLVVYARATRSSSSSSK